MIQTLRGNTGRVMEVIALKQQGILEITGRDAIKFFQGYCTCNLEALVPGKSLLGAITNIQGRVETTFIVALDSEHQLTESTNQSLLISMHRDMVNPIIQLLQHYIVFSKATLIDRSSDLYCYGVMSCAPLADQFTVSIEQRSARQEIWTNQVLGAAISDNQWQEQDIEEGLVWINEAQRGRFQPYELGLSTNGAVDFQKGCYLGQEIIARVQYRGKPKKVLINAEADGESYPGQQVYTEDNTLCGEIVASIQTKTGALCAAIVDSTVREQPIHSDTAVLTIRL